MKRSKSSTSATTTNLDATEIKLVPEQKRALDLARSGASMFLTGGAGTGKTELLKHIIALFPAKTVARTASTGMAAVHIHGTTIHSFAGIGLGQGSKEELVKRVCDNKLAVKRWLECKVLIIDEISMISGDTFDKIEEVARRARRSSRPFGGIQVILCGDFLQLPPVDKSQQVKLCFEAECWPNVVKHIVLLKHVHRQSDDRFISILAELRTGDLSASTIELLKSCEGRKPVTLDSIGFTEPTRLYPKKEPANAMNDAKLAELKGKIYQYDAKFDGTEYDVEQLKNSSVALPILQLKEKAQVLLIRNVDPKLGLVNGTRGFVKSFVESEADPKVKYPLVKFINGVEQLITPEIWERAPQGKVLARMLQVPLIMAWAITMHKCQGMTLDLGELHMSQIFERNQAYTAYSRFRSLAGVQTIGFDPSKIRTCPKAKKFYAELEADQAARENALLPKPSATPLLPMPLPPTGTCVSAMPMSLPLPTV